MLFARVQQIGHKLTLSASSIQVCLRSSSSMPIPMTALITAWQVATLPALSHSSASWEEEKENRLLVCVKCRGCNIFVWFMAVEIHTLKIFRSQMHKIRSMKHGWIHRMNRLGQRLYNYFGLQKQLKSRKWLYVLARITLRPNQTAELCQSTGI